MDANIAAQTVAQAIGCIQVRWVLQGDSVDTYDGAGMSPLDRPTTAKSAAMPYAGDLSFLSEWSDRREATAACVARHWTERPVAPMRLADIGTGDGELLALILGNLRPGTREVDLVEPDPVLALRATTTLDSIGVRGRVYDAAVLESRSEVYSHLLAAHVVYYLKPLTEWFARITKALSPGAAMTVVIRGEECDTFGLRRYVHASRGTHSLLSVEALAEHFARHGLEVKRVDMVKASMIYPYLPSGPVLPGCVVSDSRLEGFIRWMARVREGEPLDGNLLAELRTFVASRVDDAGLMLRLEDVVVTAVKGTDG